MLALLKARPSTGLFLTTLAGMLAGRRLEWLDLQALLATRPSSPTVTVPAEPEIMPVRKFTHRRQHTTDGSPAEARGVPQVGLESRAGELPSPLVTSHRRTVAAKLVAVVISTPGAAASGGAARRSQSQHVPHVAGGLADPSASRSSIDRSSLRPPLSFKSLRKITEENLRKGTEDNIRLM